MPRRVILIVADSLGVGEAPDAAKYGDVGANTLRTLHSSGKLFIPNLRKMGLFNIDGTEYARRSCIVRGAYGRMMEQSAGKDTISGHYEIAGLITHKAQPTYPNGFPKEILDKIREISGRDVLCNLPYSGTDVIRDYGMEHERTGALIVYTSADSVLQIAANEKVVDITELYSICEQMREFMTGEHNVGRIIARPYVRTDSGFKRTPNRKDFANPAPGTTMLDVLKKNGLDVVGLGKISNIFAGRGLTHSFHTDDNKDGLRKLNSLVRDNFDGLLFLNLVDFDSKYGHRNDIEGYAKAMSYFDKHIPQFTSVLSDEDLVIITGDHGCDPGFHTTDHTREYVPVLLHGLGINNSVNLGTRNTFADISATILEYFGIENTLDGTSMLKDIPQKPYLYNK